MGGAIWPKGYSLNKLGRGPLGDDTNQILTNIIHFTDNLCIFTSVFNLSLLKYSFD